MVEILLDYNNASNLFGNTQREFLVEVTVNMKFF